MIANAHVRVVLAPFAGARIAELGDGLGNAAASIGLLRDATDPQPPVSPRDFIAGYTHPLPAGTFNREYGCDRMDLGTTARATCSYDAPDLPSGGAVFKRTLTLNGSSSEVMVAEDFAPHDPRSTARLESISGFAFVPGDRVLTASQRDAVGIMHGTRLVRLSWRPGDLAHLDLRQTRGAELVTLIFARRSVQLGLGVYHVDGAAEAQRVVDAKQP